MQNLEKQENPIILAAERVFDKARRTEMGKGLTEFFHEASNNIFQNLMAGIRVDRRAGRSRFQKLAGQTQNIPEEPIPLNLPQRIRKNLMHEFQEFRKFNLNEILSEFGAYAGRDMLTFLSTYPAALPNFDGFLDGMYLEKLKPDLVPKPETVKKLQFLDCESYEGLKTKTIERIRNFGEISNFFPPEIVEPFDNESSKYMETKYRRNFQSDKIIELLNFVEEDMNYKDKRRRTGEPSFAHELRIVNRLLKLTQAVNRRFIYSLTHPQDTLRKGWINNIFFTPEDLEAIIILAILHDYTEDKSEDNKKQLGIAEQINSTDPDIQIKQGIKIKSNKRPGNFIDIPMNSENSELVIRHLKALKKPDHLSDQEAIVHLYEELNEILNDRQPKDVRTIITLYLAGFLVKIEDHMDNLFTGTVEWKQETQTYIPRSLKSIARKANGNITDTLLHEFEIRLNSNLLFPRFSYRNELDLVLSEYLGHNYDRLRDARSLDSISRLDIILSECLGFNYDRLRDPWTFDSPSRLATQILMGVDFEDLVYFDDWGIARPR